MGYVHVEIEASQTTKRRNSSCGDVFLVERKENSTVIILADGLGSGVKANIYATLCVARLQELLQQGFSIRKAFLTVAITMDEAAKSNLPYAVFSIARILNDGLSVVLSYEMPPPILISKGSATILQQRTATADEITIKESNYRLETGDGILLVSDGATQAGIGARMPEGLGSKGLCNLAVQILKSQNCLKDLPLRLSTRISLVSKDSNEDDVSLVLAFTRVGRVANVLTGPPLLQTSDRDYAKYFLQSEGTKIICGGTSSNIIADSLHKEIKVDTTYANHFTPPKLSLEGIDLVTEGALTLNQLYNIIDENRDEMDEFNPVTELYDYMMNADKIVFFVGAARNPAADKLQFVQQGILTRNKILPLLQEKLKSMGKVVAEEKETW